MQINKLQFLQYAFRKSSVNHARYIAEKRLLRVYIHTGICSMNLPKVQRQRTYSQDRAVGSSLQYFYKHPACKISQNLNFENLLAYGLTC